MIKFIDANCMLGKPMKPVEGTPETVSDYIEIMDRAGVEKAIVHHVIAKESYLLRGNQILIDEIAGNDRFIPQWILAPSPFDEYYEPEAWVQKMKKHNVRCVRLFPRAHNFSLAPFESGKLINTLAKHKIPIFMDGGQVDNLEKVLKDYPDAKFIICEPGYEGSRRWTTLAMEYKNLYIETSNFVAHNVVPRFCKLVGADRLICGSAMPRGSATGAVSFVRYTDISEAEKKKIAYDNIATMLAEVEF